jgi:hypothetical protein
MDWKFWGKSASSSAGWPEEANDSLRLLAAMYGRDTSPFTEWREPRFSIDHELEPLFRANVRAYQLHVWFAMYLAEHGEVQAGMLRDAFPLVMDELFPSKGMGDRTGDLLELQASACAHFMNLPAEVRNAAMQATTLESIPQWHYACYLLVSDPESSYLPEDEVPESQKRALAACMEKACDAAKDAFTPLLKAIKRFDAAKLPGCKWSEKMGAHERHLWRRQYNPLFAPERRAVTVSDVYAARVLDTKDFNEVSTALQSLGRQLADLQPDRDWNVTLDKIRKQLEALQYHVAGMDRRGDDLRSGVKFLKDHAVGFATDILKHIDPSQVPNIEKAEALQAQFLAEKGDWSWQVLRGDVIPDDEIVEALLCESAEAIAQVVIGAKDYKMGPIDFLTSARITAVEIARRVRAEGSEVPGMEEKLKALGVDSGG